ncbi:MAG: dicarboxylate/amino acid:cation symporter [Crocinitomicaceae bacterium]|nr:dicarboxylate/amino acid:cation symporter [Crocinitomicaceae bacterium]
MRVLVALVLGVGAGLLLSPANEIVSQSLSENIGNWLALPGKLFLKLVQMIMIPLIVTSIISGLISASGDQLKKVGGGLTIYFVITTALAVTIGVILTNLIQPGKHFSGLLPENTAPALPTTSEPQVSPFQDIPKAISDLLPENPLASMVSGEMLAIVIFSIIIGLAMTQLNDKQYGPVSKGISAIQEICMIVVKWAMKLVPFAVFGLVAQLISTIGLDSLTSVGLYVGTVILGLTILLMFYLSFVFILAKKNPFTFLKTIREVQLLAFSTTSSAAVMPLSIKVAQENLGVRKSISNFIIPIGATVNMDGTALYQVISTLFIVQAYGIEMDMAALILVMVTIIAASIGTPAIPGGGVIILASVLQGAGIPTEGIVMIIGVERILGMFRTAINVTGDLTACVVFERLGGKNTEEHTPVAS